MNRIPRFLTRPLALAAVAFSLLLGVSGCASTANVGVTSDFDHAVNFRAYRTWAWYPQQVGDVEQGPSNGRYESFLDQRMRKAIAQELANKGMTQVQDNPDVFVAYSARVEDKQQMTNTGYNPYWGYGYGMYGRGYPSTYNYKAGTVVIDIVDARRKELAWRGTGQAQVDNNSISETETYRIVNGILGIYPPQDNPNVRNQARR